MLDKMRKLLLLFRSIDPRSVFSAFYIVICYALFHLSWNKPALCKRWKNKGAVLSFQGVKFFVNAVPGDLGFIFEVFVQKGYEYGNSFIPRPGDVCVDIGTNIGTNALNWRLYNPNGRIICIEPHPETIKRLTRNVDINKFMNIEIYPYAASNQNGQIEMYTDEDSTMLVAGDSHKANRHLITSVTLDSLMQTLLVDSIALCKIDVEGHEVSALKGAAGSLRMIRRLVIEYHSENLKNAVKDLLNDQFLIVHETVDGVCGLLFAENRLATEITVI